jgi:hypothetical protein
MKAMFVASVLFLAAALCFVAWPRELCAAAAVISLPIAGSIVLVAAAITNKSQ